MAIAYLGMGTNLRDRRRNLREGLLGLREFAAIEAVSSVYESEPVGERDQPVFWNLVVRISTHLEPAELLRRTREIERRLGRVNAVRNAPRTLDIDLLLHDDRIVREEGIEVPHPRMLGRAFVLRPLAELDPGLRHPTAGRTIREILEASRGLEWTRRLFPGAELLAGAEP